MASLHRFLMCPPAYYGAAQEGGRWKSAGPIPVDRASAAEQWQGLFDWLSAVNGTAVEQLEPVKALTDLVFTAGAGFVKDGRFIKSRYRLRQRRQEEIEIERWFRKKNYDVKLPADPFCFEGERDLLRIGRELYWGYHSRGDWESFESVANLVKQDPLVLEITDGRFYHLDTCLGALNDQTALVYPAAFEPYAYRTLCEMVPDLIRVCEEEALRLVCNSVCVDQHVVMPKGCPETRKAVEGRGFEVTELDFSEYLKYGAAAKALVLSL